MTVNYSAIIVITILSLVVLVSMVHANGRLDQQTKKDFYYICIVISIAAFWEWMAVYMDGASVTLTGLHLLAKCMDYSTTPLCCLPFIHLMSTKRRFFNVMRILLSINIFLQIASVFTGWTFYLDEANVHQHGPIYAVYMLICAISVVAVLLSFLEYGRRYENKNRGPLFAIVGLLIISVFFQEYFGGEVRTDYLGMAICTILLYIHFIEFKQINQDRAMVQKESQLVTDALTGALSRYAYMQTLSEYSEKGSLPEGLVAFEADLNGLKVVNDTIGHEAGDELLYGASQVLKNVIADQGKVFRTGGDEFVILLDPQHAPVEQLMSMIREQADAWKGEYSKSISFSIGHASAEEFPSLDLLQLVHEADKRMYEDKERYYSMPGHERRRR